MGRYWAGLLLVVSPWGSYTAVSYQHRFLSEEFGTRTCLSTQTVSSKSGKEKSNFWSQQRWPVSQILEHT